MYFKACPVCLITDKNQWSSTSQHWWLGRVRCLSRWPRLAKKAERVSFGSFAWQQRFTVSPSFKFHPELAFETLWPDTFQPDSWAVQKAVSRVKWWRRTAAATRGFSPGTIKVQLDLVSVT